MKNGPRPVEFLLHQLCVEPAPRTRTLHNRSTWGRLTTHKERYAHDPFIADHGNFCRRPVFHHIQKRHNRCERKIHMLERDSRLVEHLTKWHLYKLERR